ncbi:cytochrome ubiquinol oxidase subunit I [Vibrio parahaemolyticus]|nr:cytochrome ubiquinol oxidase subunit I [Vibrio parahaemolyticus]
MVALGTIISTFWILASNSWMQTPQGYEIVDGRVVPTDWFAIVFNPSFPYRLAHMSVAAFVSSALFVGASAAWHLLRGNQSTAVKTMFSMSLGILVFLAPLQAVIGDVHGLNTLEHQPAKIAAIEGHWDNSDGKPTPLILFGIPNMEQERTDYALEIPVLGSLILRHSLTEPIPALKDFPKEERPNSPIVFWSFRIMVGLGLLMIFQSFYSMWLRKRTRFIPRVGSSSFHYLWGHLVLSQYSLAGLRQRLVGNLGSCMAYKKRVTRFLHTETYK